MLVAALGMALLFFILTQCLAELAGALPQGGGFDYYAQYALGPAAGYLAGMSVAVALAVGTVSRRHSPKLIRPRCSGLAAGL